MEINLSKMRTRKTSPVNLFLKGVNVDMCVFELASARSKTYSM